MSDKAERRKNEIAEAQRVADSNLCFWFFGCFLVFVLIALVIGPGHHYNHGHGHGHGYGHRHYDDDDDTDHSWSYYNGDDDDDESSHSHPIILSSHIATQSHEDILLGDYLGTHPKTAGCESDAHSAELMAAAKANLKHPLIWPKGVLPPTASVEFNELTGNVEFSVTAPYFSQDAA